MTQPNLTWDICKAAFEVDGSLRDIYVHNTTLADWERFLAYARGFALSLTYDWVETAIPDRAAEIFQSGSDHAVLLQIERDGVTVNCHFFSQEELECDVDPKEITSQRALDVIIDFLAGVGSALGKEVLLTGESAPHAVFFRYDPETGQLAYCPD